MRPFDYVLFDLDGTLTQSGEGIKKCAAHAIEAMGFPPLPDERLASFVGPPLIPMFIEACGMTEEEAQRAVAIYRVRFEAVGWSENRVYAGIPALLKALKSAGVHVALATAKPEPFALRIAEHFGMAPFFDRVAGASMDERHADKAELIRRALPEGADFSRAAMVGDRRFDIDGARRAGIHSVGVAYGYGSREELEKANPDAIAQTVNDLFQILGVSRPRGRFVTFEGTDGCGKSTQQRLLAEWLSLRGYEAVVTREPGGCPISERIRELVLDVGALGMTDPCEALLFAAARAQHIHDVIRPALNSGKIVLCDRFLDSSIAYQAHGRELGETFVRQINAPAEAVAPDLTLVYALDAETAKERVLSQSAPDRIEVEKGEYFARVERAYSDIARREPERVRVVNANGTIEEVFEKTLELAKDFLQKE